MIMENDYLTSLISILQGENSLKISKRITACNMLKSSFHKRPPSLSLHLSSAISVHMFTQETSSPNWHTLCMENKHGERKLGVWRRKNRRKIITSLLSSLPTLEILLAGVAILGNLSQRYQHTICRAVAPTYKWQHDTFIWRRFHESQRLINLPSISHRSNFVFIFFLCRLLYAWRFDVARYL